MGRKTRLAQEVIGDRDITFLKVFASLFFKKRLGSKGNALVAVRRRRNTCAL